MRRNRNSVSYCHNPVIAGMFLIPLMALFLVFSSSDGPLCSGNAQSAPPSVIYCPYWTMKEGFNASLMLANTSDERIRVLAEVYNTKGGVLLMPEIRLGGRERVTLDVKRWLTGMPAPDAFAEGSLILRYTGNSFALAALLTVTDPTRSLSFDFPAEMKSYFYSSTMLEGLWWMVDAQTSVKLILTNTSAGPLNVVPILTVGQSKATAGALSLGPHETRTMAVDEILGLGGLVRGNILEGGIQLKHTGGPGDLMANVTLSNNRGFSSTLKFIDPAAQRSREIHAPGILVQGSYLPGMPFLTGYTTIILLRNTTDREVQVQGSFDYTAAGVTRSVRIPPIRLGVSETRRIDLGRVVSQRVRLPDRLESAGLEIEYDGVPGGILAVGTSFDGTTTMAFDRLLRNPQILPTDSFSFPWKIEGDFQSLVQIKNTSREQRSFWLNLSYQGQANFRGGEYEVGTRSLAPGETAVIDIRELRDRPVEDRLGRVLPSWAVAGQAQWVSIEGDHELIGRVSIYSPSQGLNTSTNELLDTGDPRCVNFIPGQCIGLYPTAPPIQGGPGQVINLTAYRKSYDCCTDVFLRDIDITLASSTAFFSSDSTVAEIDPTIKGKVVLRNPGTATVTLIHQVQPRYCGQPNVFGCFTQFGDLPRTFKATRTINVTAQTTSVQITNTALSPATLAPGGNTFMQITVDYSAGMQGRSITVTATRTIGSAECVDTTPGASSPTVSAQYIVPAAQTTAGSQVLTLPISVALGSCSGTATFRATVSAPDTQTLTPPVGRDQATLGIVRPMIFSVTPSGLARGSTATVQIAGESLTSAIGPTTLSTDNVAVKVTLKTATSALLTADVCIPWTTIGGSLLITAIVPGLGSASAPFGIMARALQAPVITAVSPSKRYSQGPPELEPGSSPLRPIAEVSKGSSVALTIAGSNFVGTTPSFLTTWEYPSPTVLSFDNCSDTTLRVTINTSGARVVGFYTMVLSNDPSNNDGRTDLLIEVDPSGPVVDGYSPGVMRSDQPALLMICGRNLDGAQVVEEGGRGLLVLQIDTRTSEMITGTLRPTSLAQPGQSVTLSVAGNEHLTIGIKGNESSGVIEAPRVRFGDGFIENPVLTQSGSPSRSGSGGGIDSLLAPERARGLNRIAPGLVRANRSAQFPIISFGYDLINLHVRKALVGEADAIGALLGTDPLRSLGVGEARPVAGLIAAAYLRVRVVVRWNFLNLPQVCIQAIGAAHIAGGPGFLVASDYCLGRCAFALKNPIGRLTGSSFISAQPCLQTSNFSPAQPLSGVFYALVTNTGTASCCGQNNTTLTMHPGTSETVTRLAFNFDGFASCSPLSCAISERFTPSTETRSEPDGPLVVLTAPPPCANIESVVFTPGTVPVGGSASLEVRVHHGSGMPGFQITVQVSQVTAPFCVAPPSARQTVSVPLSRSAAGTVELNFPVSAATCQGATLATYKATIPLDQGIRVSPPAMSDTASLSVSAMPAIKLTLSGPGAVCEGREAEFAVEATNLPAAGVGVDLSIMNSPSGPGRARFRNGLTTLSLNNMEFLFGLARFHIIGVTPSAVENDMTLRAELRGATNPPAPTDRKFSVADSIVTKDVIVVGWVDGQAQQIDEVGVSPGLIGSLNSAFGCVTTLLQWSQGVPVYVLDSRTGERSEPNRRYANAWLIRNSGNPTPVAELTGPAVDAFTSNKKNYRLFARFLIEMCVLNGQLIAFPTILKRQALVGDTPEPCSGRQFYGADGEYAPDNDSFSPQDSVRTGLLNRGRIGEKGQAANATINRRTTPYVWSKIIFSALKADGSYDDVPRELFPTYSIYVDGKKVPPDFKQSDVELFIRLGAPTP